MILLSLEERRRRLQECVAEHLADGWTLVERMDEVAVIAFSQPPDPYQVRRALKVDAYGRLFFKDPGKKYVPVDAAPVSQGLVASSSPQSNGSAVGGVLGLLLFAGMAWFWFGGGLEQQTGRSLDKIYGKVANDAVDQYNIAKRNGTSIDVCVHAGLVTAAYLQAKDEAEYSAWKATEAADCRAAGVPR